MPRAKPLQSDASAETFADLWNAQNLHDVLCALWHSREAFQTQRQEANMLRSAARRITKSPDALRQETGLARKAIDDLIFVMALNAGQLPAGDASTYPLCALPKLVEAMQERASFLKTAPSSRRELSIRRHAVLVALKAWESQNPGKIRGKNRFVYQALTRAGIPCPDPIAGSSYRQFMALMPSSVP